MLQQPIRICGQTRNINRFKVVLLGDTGVGKSSIGVRFACDEFRTSHENTIGAAFLQRALMVGETKVKLDVWDTAGQERYRSLAPMYYRRAQAAIVVYDITKKETYHCAVKWADEVKKTCPNAVIAIVGNKCDLVGYKYDLAGNKYDLDECESYREEGEDYAKENGALFMATSAKTGENVEKLFQAVAERRPKQESKQQETGTNSVDDEEMNVAQDQPRCQVCGCCSG